MSCNGCTELVPIPVYELLLVYKALGEPHSMKVCYQAVSDYQAVRDALDHVNAVAEPADLTVLSLEVFCVELGFRGMDPVVPDMISSRVDRQIYATNDLDVSLIEELPERMEERLVS